MDTPPTDTPWECPAFCAPITGYTVTLNDGGGNVFEAEGDTPQAACDAFNAKMPEGFPRVQYREDA